MTLVSVIMPVKNGAEHVKQAIDSILVQTYTELQLIIINDGSTDNTWPLLNSFEDNRVILIDNPKPGLVNSLNMGIKLAEGEFIARMDADDIALPERIEKQIHFLRKNEHIGVVSCLVEPLPEKGNNNGYAVHVDFINCLRTPSQHYLNRFVDSTVAHPSVMFRSALLVKYGAYHEFNGPEDYELWLRWFEKGVRFAKVPEVLMIWNDSPNRLSRSSGLYHRDNFFELKAQYFAQWKTKKTISKDIWIWGYGKVVFRRTAMLEKYGISIAGYIDVQEHSQTKRMVIHFNNYDRSLGFVLVYVSDRDGKQLIQEFLDQRGAVAGIDYYFMT